MAEQEKVQEEISEKSEPSVKPKAKGKPKPKATPKVEAPKPYVHIDTFLQTAISLYGLTAVQAAGFKARMQGRHYQRDEKVFLEELKKHLSLKD
jgi:hypothetical protein